ncbi:MAG: hypothetical protein ACR2NL_06885 [Acidimicrobiia bacterium]
MNLGELHSLVQRVVNRGTLYDADIITQTRIAARWLERNRSYRYMRKLCYVSLDAGDTEVIYGDGFVKSVIFFRIQVEAQWHYLTMRDPHDFANFGIPEEPKHYYLEEDRRFILNVEPDKNYDGQIFLRKFTDWPVTALADVLTTTETNWLLENADDALLARTLIQLSPIVRNARLIGEYSGLLSDSLKTLEIAEGALEEDNSDHQMSMPVG